MKRVFRVYTSFSLPHNNIMNKSVVFFKLTRILPYGVPLQEKTDPDSTTCFICYRISILQITQPSQYRCTQLQYSFAVISEAPRSRQKGLFHLTLLLMKGCALKNVLLILRRFFEHAGLIQFETNGLKRSKGR